MASTAVQGGMNQGWFVGAPVTKIVAFTAAITFALIESRKVDNSLAVDVNAARFEGEFYRFVTGAMTFSTMGELVVGLIVLVTFSRRYEREMGTRKYCVFLLGVNVVAILAEIIASELFLEYGLRYSGPYRVLGALLGMFHRFAPRLYPRFFGILGFHFSEKTIAYLFAAQIIFYNGLSSIIPSTCGFLAGCLMSAPPCSQLDVPDFVASVGASIGERFFDGHPSPVLPRQQRGGNRRHDTAAAGPVNNHRAMPQPASPLPPPDSMVEQLTSMGFERDAVVRALRASHNNLEQAAERLLSGT